MIRVTELTKEYGSRRAIDNISFDANSGEILGFLGPNGAGKTTTMRILTGYMPPTSGKVEVGGFDVVDQSLEVRKLVGYLPETVPLYTEMTVFDYLYFMANLRKVQNAEDRVDDVIEMVHLEDRAESYIEKLSKGMRQRVGLAQALLHSPKVLILDEPTIGLDPVQIIEVRNLIREIGKERTVLLSTHILSEAQQVCNRVLIINHGKIVAEDTPSRLQARLTGAARVTARIRGDASDAVALVQNIPGITHIAVGEEGEFEFEANPGIEVRPDVAKTLISNGFDLLELRSSNLSLEDIFLQLTREEPAAPEIADPTEVESNKE